MGQDETAVTGAQDGAFQALSNRLKGRLSQARQSPPFPGGPSTREWRLLWEGSGFHGRLVASTVQMEGQRTDSTWISIDAEGVDPVAWMRIATRALADTILGGNVPYRRGSLGNPALSLSLVMGLPPGPSEAAKVYGPEAAERDWSRAIEATDALVRRMGPALPSVLTRLQELGDFTMEVDDGTLSVRFTRLFDRPEAYDAIIACAQQLANSARGA